MSVVPNRKKIHIAHCALLLGCLLAQQSASARSDNGPTFFQAASLADSNAFAVTLPVDNVKADAPLVPFAPSLNVASVSALIASLENTGDFYSPRIAELSEQLGKALQADAQYLAALDAYDRSFQIVRRHEGLFSAAQASLLQVQIKCHLALGNLEVSDELQHSLFRMQQRVLAEKPVALADANLAFADWNLKYYLQVRQAPVPGGRTDAQEKALAERLGDAFMQYHQALWLFTTATVDGLHEAGLYDRKVATERRIAAVTLMVDRLRQRDVANTLTKLGQHSIHQSRRAHQSALLDHGSAALQRAIDYSVATAEPVLIAERELELADWYLLMDQHDEASATYATAVELLRDEGIQEQQIAAMLESGQPVEDPEAALLTLAEGQAINNYDGYDGYIDVTFDLSRYGKASNARVLAGTSHDEQIEEDLLRQIHDGRFRPGFEQGTPVDREDVTLRYYFAR